jgi:hypothetical protein
MQFARLFAFSLASVAFVSTVPLTAHALEPAATAESVQLTGGIRFATEDMNFGLGARGGYTLPMNLYLGGSFDYFFGEDHDFVGYEFHTSAWTLSFEGGYDFGITPELVVRPFGGLGVVWWHWDCSEIDPFLRVCPEDTESDFVFSTGGLLYYVAGSLLVGPELRFLFVDGEVVAVFGGNIGGRF